MSIPTVLVAIPATALLMFIGIEMPRPYKRLLFKIPVWLTSSVLALSIGFVGRGVLGPMTGFVSELILFPGFYLIKKQMMWADRREAKRNDKGSKL